MHGDGINDVAEAVRTRSDRIRFIQVRHEEPAAFMACAFAKFSGKIGCWLPSSCGATVMLSRGSMVRHRLD